MWNWYSTIFQNFDISFVAPGCTCDPRGTEDGLQCAHNPTGECRCKLGVVGSKCDRCDNGYYGFGQSSRTGCRSKLRDSK